MSVRAILAVLPAVLQRDYEDEVYRQYTAEALRLISECVASRLSGAYLQHKYEDIIHPKPQDTRTGEEIIAHMKSKLRQIGGDT